MVGILGIISLFLLSASIRSTKNGGIDGRTKIKWGLTLLSLVVFVIALLLSMEVNGISRIISVSTEY